MATHVTATGIVYGAGTTTGWFGRYHSSSFVTESGEKWGYVVTEDWPHSRVGHIVTVSGYLFLHRSRRRIFRPKMKHHCHKELPQWCFESEALGLLRNMRANHEDKMPRVVFADWLEQGGIAAGEGMAEIARKSLESRSFEMFPQEAIKTTFPFTGAWNGWLLACKPEKCPEGVAAEWLKVRHLADPNLTPIMRSNRSSNY